MKKISLALMLAAGGAAAQDGLERALTAELARSARLEEKGYPPPYYVSLTATDVEVSEIRCSLGAQLSHAAVRHRALSADLRVGSHEMDSHPVSGAAAVMSRQAGMDGDEFSLRHHLWSLLDAAYKSASASFLRKQALRVTRGRTEYDTDDLSREKSRSHRQAQPPPPWTPELARELCLETSRVFKSDPGLLRSEVSVSFSREWSRLRDSEKSAVDFGRDIAEIEIDAVAMAADGMKTPVARRYAAVSAGGLPDAAKLRAESQEMLDELHALTAAASTSPFSAPALIDPSAAGALVFSMGLRLSGEEQRNPGGAQTFRDKLGKRVLPESLTLIDDPTLSSYEGEALAGHYAFDEQGMPAAPVMLIERGVLRGFLLSRYPAAGFLKSNGHGRAPAGGAAAGQPANLFLKAAKTVAQDRLIDELRRQCRLRGKPQGIWIKRLRQFAQTQAAGGRDSIRLSGLIYLVDAASGRLTLVRDLDAVGTPLVLMGQIIAAGAKPAVNNVVAGLPFSVVTPSLLLSDLELQRADTKPEKLPILPPPGAERR